MSDAKAIFMAAVQGEIKDRAAVGCVNQTATYAQMDATGARWPEANYDAEVMSKLALGAADILGWDAVRVPFCQTIEEEALGCSLKPGDDKNLPSIAEHAFNPKDTPNPTFPEDFMQRGRVQMLIKAVELTKKAVGDSRAIIGGVIGPFTIVSELIGIKACLRCVLKSQDALTPYLEVATKAATELANALVKAGADVICIEDMMASVDMISPTNYKTLALPWEQKMIKDIDAPVILHICGKVDMIVEGMIDSGAAGLSFEPKTDIEAVKKAVAASGKKVGLIGGIDTIEDLFHGDADMVKNSTKKALADGYHIIAPGCSVPPATSTEKLKAMMDTVLAK